VTAIYETVVPSRLDLAVKRAEAHGLFVDANHLYGVLAEEVAEVFDEVRGDRTGLEQELWDVIGACMKAIRQIEKGTL